MSGKQVRAQYTQEFKLEAVRQVKAGQSISVVAKVLGIPKASLGNWVRQELKGALSGAGDKPASVTPEQMELARLRAENARLRMERDIAKKPRRTLRRMCCEVRLDPPNEKALAGEHLVRGAGCQRQRVFHLATPGFRAPGACRASQR
jgi:transposase